MNASATAIKAELPLEVYDLAINIATNLLTGYYLNIDPRSSTAWIDFGCIVDSIALQISHADHDLMWTLGRERDKANAEAAQAFSQAAEQA
jgi:hypothetical protein